MAESKGLSVSPTDEDDQREPDEPTSAAETEPQSEPQAEAGAEAGAEAEAEESSEAEPAGYRMRRAPRYGAFGFTGVLVGVVFGAVLAMSFQATGDYSAQTILGYFIAIFGLFGALFGAAAAVFLDRRKD